MGVWDKPIPIRVGGANLWDYLEVDLQRRAYPEASLSVWAQVSIQPGGLWDEAQDETLVIRPEGVGIWQAANEETLILPRGERKSVWQAAEDQAREAVVRGEKKTDLWRKVEDETLVVGRPKANVWNQLKIRDLAGHRPVRALGWALKKLQTAQGRNYYILKNLRQGTYLRLSEEQVYLWNLMDGSHSIQDMVVASFIAFQTLSIDALLGLLDQLQAKGFLVSAAVDVYQAASLQLWRRSPAYWGRRLVMLLFASELSIKAVDPFYTALYRLFGWTLFTRPAQALILLISLAGLPAFFYVTQRGDLSLITGASGVLSVGLVGLLAGEIFSVFLHESAHALTTKRYGRQVRRGGVGLYFGMLTFFMDTTDIWMEPRRPRLAVTWAGPYSGFFLGGAASLLLLISPSTVWGGLAYQFATFCYAISFFNLNPLLKLDGYYLLMDWLEMPMLRERSMTFVRTQLWARLSARQTLTRDERIYAVFGVLAIIWAAVAIVSMVELYGGALLDFMEQMVGATAAWAIVVVLVGIAGGLLLRGWLTVRSKAPPQDGAAAGAG